jgi:hypothetical protein
MPLKVHYNKNKKHSYRSETALASKQRKKFRTRGMKRRLEADQQEEVKNKFIANVPELLLEVTLFQFRFSACCLK